MLGSFAAPESLDKKTIQPIIRYGLATMSIGYLVDMNTPMIWRGPMVSGALQQLLSDTQWPDLDYLIIDLPPGTGDIQLTLAQKIPVSGAIIVTTPQDLALLDARRAVGMFNKVNIPVLGIIENMSLHTCGACGHTEAIFGQGGAAKMAEEFKLPVLGELPLDIRIREHTDQGTPSVAADPKSAVSAHFCDIARRAAARLALQAKSHNTIFPKIVVQHT
jgi:ATP-binding protein involved in chromosome partitioning